jgi:mRNA interferase RelE/StbE
MVWRIEFLPAAAKDLSRLDRPTAQRILAFLDQRIRTARDPRSIGEALTGGRLGDHWKYRVGDYRLIVSIVDTRVLVNVVRISHRSTVYRAR